jgi:hypothetical protein
MPFKFHGSRRCLGVRRELRCPIWCGPRCASGGVTAIDGYQMAKKGRTGKPLATTEHGLFFAGTVARARFIDQTLGALIHDQPAIQRCRLPAAALSSDAQSDRAAAPASSVTMRPEHQRRQEEHTDKFL